MSGSSKSKLEKFFYFLLALVILGPITAITSYIFYAKDVINEELKVLTAEREAAFQVVRPAFMAYLEDNRVFPDELNKLVPSYIDSIPKVLVSEEDEFPAMVIDYEYQGELAYFHFQTEYGQAQKVSFDIFNNDYVDK